MLRGSEQARSGRGGMLAVAKHSSKLQLGHGSAVIERVESNIKQRGKNRLRAFAKRSRESPA